MHTCPECGQACTCNGDIDDIMFDGGLEEMFCECCDGYDDYLDDDFDDED